MQPNPSRRPRGRIVTGLAIAGVTLAACGTGSATSSSTTERSKPKPTTSTTSTPPSTSMSTTTMHSTTEPRADALTVSATKRFPDANQWTVDTQPPEKPGHGGVVGQGTITYTGPDKATIMVSGPVAGYVAANVTAVGQRAVAAQHITVTGGPSTIHLDGQPAVAYAGTNPQGQGVGLVATELGLGGVYVVELTAPLKTFKARVPAFDAIIASIKFPAGVKP